MSPTSYQTAPPRGVPVRLATLPLSLQAGRRWSDSVRGGGVSLAAGLGTPDVGHDVDHEGEADDEPAEPAHLRARRVADRPGERRPRQEGPPEQREPERVERDAHAV